MLKEYIRKPWLNVYLFLFSHKMVSVQQKLNVKSLSEKYQALKDFESDLTKKLLKNTQMLIFWKKIKINEVFSLSLPLNCSPLVSQCTKHSLSFTPMKSQDFEIFFAIPKVFTVPMELQDRGCRL